jgi:hypothetical protein
MDSDMGSVFIVYGDIVRVESIGLGSGKSDDDAVNDAYRQATLVARYNLSRSAVATVEQLPGRRQLCRGLTLP